MRIDDAMIYLTDNGRALCGEHLGASARSTGRDISGQEIIPVTADVARMARALGAPLACESCGRKPSAAGEDLREGGSPMRTQPTLLIAHDERGRRFAASVLRREHYSSAEAMADDVYCGIEEMLVDRDAAAVVATGPFGRRTVRTMDAADAIRREVLDAG